MRIGVVTQVRNEADILPAFLSHIAAFADDAVLMDHGSVDGSAGLLDAACRGRPGWAAWRIAVPGHHQAAFTGFAAHRLLRSGVDRVLFLDADEFVDLPHRAALAAALAPMDQPGDIGVWHWRDCVPDRLDVAPMPGDMIWQAPAPSRYPKVVLSQALFRASGGQAGPAAGAHFVGGAGIPTRNVLLGDLLHLPVRSMEQMRRKVVLGSLAKLAQSDRGPTDTSHWAEALARIAAGAMGDDDLRGMAARYGEPGAASDPLTPDGLAARGFTRRTLSVASTGVAAPAQAPAVNAWQAMADAVLHWAPARSDNLVLELVGNVLRAAEPPAVWPDPFLLGTPLLDLARTVLPVGARVLAIGVDAGLLDVRATPDPASGPFDAALVGDLTPVRLAAAHAALPPGGLLVGEGDAGAASPELRATLSDCLAPTYGEGAARAPDTAWRTAMDGMFQIERSEDIGGALLRPAMAGRAGRFDWADPQDATAGRLVAVLDQLLTRHGAVPPGRVAVVARRLG